jgi:phage terminase large subunit
VAIVEIPYRPRNWAKSFHAELVRWAVLVLHRRAGKTTALMNQHLRAAMDDDWERARLLKIRPALTGAELEELLHPPGGRHYGHVMPTRVQAKQTTWDRLKFYAGVIPGVKPNESELLLRLPSGNKIQLFGADDPDSLRGIGPSGISFDEFSQQPENIFSEIISKALADHLGYAIFAGTIKGKDHLYETHAHTDGDKAWFRLWQDVDVSLATEEGITIQNLETAMEDDRKQITQGLMTQDEYDQEWFLSPEASIKGAWFGKEMLAAKNEGRITRVPYDPALPVDTDWDLGVDDAMAIWFSQSLRSGEIRLIDYYEASGEGFPHYVGVLANRGYIYGKHHPPHDIAVREMGTGKSRKETAKSLGLTFQEPMAALDLADGINAARLCLAKCWIDTDKCAKGIEALRNYRKAFNKRLNEFTGTPVHNWASHGADAYRTLAVRHRPPTAPKQRERQSSPLSWMG